MNSKCPNCICLLDKDGTCPMCKNFKGSIAEHLGSKLQEVQGHSMPEEDWRSILDEHKPLDNDTLYAELALRFPYGHEQFIQLSIEEMALHSKKNYDYAYGGDSLGNFNRVSAIKKLYPGIDWTTPAATALDYMLKQQDAVMWPWSQGYEGQVEGTGKRIEDIYVYWKIIRILLEII